MLWTSLRLSGLQCRLPQHRLETLGLAQLRLARCPLLHSSTPMQQLACRMQSGIIRNRDQGALGLRLPSKFSKGQHGVLEHAYFQHTRCSDLSDCSGPFGIPLAALQYLSFPTCLLTPYFALHWQMQRFIQFDTADAYEDRFFSPG